MEERDVQDLYGLYAKAKMGTEIELWIPVALLFIFLYILQNPMQFNEYNSLILENSEHHQHLWWMSYFEYPDFNIQQVNTEEVLKDLEKEVRRQWTEEFFIYCRQIRPHSVG